MNQVLVEIETAKAAVELPSPWAGTVGELLAQPGDTVAVGAPIIAIETAEAGAAPAAAAAAPPPPPRRPAEERGAKIGEAGADGRIATLVGYGPRPGSVTRRPRRATAAAPALRRRPSSSTPVRIRTIEPGPASTSTRRAAAQPGSWCRWPSRRCASWPATSASTCAPSPGPGPAA